MTYVEGFVSAVPRANKQAYLKHAQDAVALFKEYGVIRFVETWGEDVPHGKLTDFYRAVDAREDEDVVFSWLEYPDKHTRDTAGEAMMRDPRMEAMSADMPFDGQRMIYAGFEAIVDHKADGPIGYADGYLVPVKQDKKEAYRALAEKAAAKFLEYGAVRVVEAWGDDVPDGKITDYRRALQTKDGEAVVFSFVEWPDKDVRNAGWEKMMADEDLRPVGEPPFDPQRMFWGGFTPLLDTGQ